MCPVVLSADGAYAMQLATGLRSLAEANRVHWPISVQVLAHDFADDRKAKVSKSLPSGSVSLQWVETDLSPFQSFSGYLDISKIIYSRLLIPSLFPETVPRVLYLDADILVLKDLGSLCETDLSGAVVGAVLDRLDARLKAGQEPDLPSVQAYFNSGVLLIDLDRWRLAHVSERAMEYLTEHASCRYPDQDALNVVCDGRWKSLDDQYNFQNHHGIVLGKRSASPDPAIVHFVTSQKPWDARSLSRNAHFYNKFRNRTCFARSRREKLADTFLRGWCRTKRRVRRTLTQHTLLQGAWKRVRRQSA